MKRTIFAALVILVVGAFPVAAGENTARSIFDLIAGDWRSDGPAFGAPASSRMNWTPALDGKYFHLDYKIEMQTSEGAKSVFHGVAYYRDTGDDIVNAFWADNSGDLHPISAERDGNALIAHWGVVGGKQGRTRYELSTSDEIAVTDWIKTADGWRQFNHNVFVRALAAN